MMNHSEAYDLIDSYAFGTLEPELAGDVESHLDSGCPDCLLRLREVGELSVMLARAVPQSDPPPQIRERLFSKIKKKKSTAKTGGGSLFSIPAWVSAVAAVVVMALGASTIYLSYQNGKLKKKVLEASDVTALLNSPGMQFVDLRGVDPNPQAFGKVVLDPDKGAAVVYMYRLPQTPEGMEYQLWVMREGKPTSAGVFTVNPDGSAMLALNELYDPSTIAAFQVTIEPEGGQTSPTGMMYLTGPNTIQSEN